MSFIDQLQEFLAKPKPSSSSIKSLTKALNSDNSLVSAVGSGFQPNLNMLYLIDSVSRTAPILAPMLVEWFSLFKLEISKDKMIKILDIWAAKGLYDVAIMEKLFKIVRSAVPIDIETLSKSPVPSAPASPLKHKAQPPAIAANNPNKPTPKPANNYQKAPVPESIMTAPKFTPGALLNSLISGNTTPLASSLLPIPAVERTLTRDPFSFDYQDEDTDEEFLQPIKEASPSKAKSPESPVKSPKRRSPQRSVSPDRDHLDKKPRTNSD